MRIDADAVLWSAPERERADRPLLLLLHGYGSHEGDLFELAPVLPLTPVIASLRAPLDLGPGNAWFPLDFDATLEERTPEADAAGRAILDWLETTQSTSVGLLGFSQGGAMALQLLRLAPQRFAYAVVLSGFVLGTSHPGDAGVAERKPPVFWGRGTLDQVIPQPAIEWTTQWLPQNTTLTSAIYEDVAHGISNPELRDVASFISGAL